MRDLSDFQRGQTVGPHLAGASVTKRATLPGIHSSSFQGYDSIQKSWEDIISQEELWPKTETK